MALIFENLNASKIMTLSREDTVFFFAVGPLEDHGPHLPVGLDGFEASHLCHALAARFEIEREGRTSVLMSRVPFGIDSNTSKLVIRVRAHVLRDWLVDSCESLFKLGFTRFVCVSGHLGPKQLTAIEEAGKFLRKKTGYFGLRRIFTAKPKTGGPILISASSALLTKKEVFRSPFKAKPNQHGGERDTSVALAISGELVQSIYPALPVQLPPQNESYWGNPGEASAEKGKQILEAQIDEIYTRLKRVWAGEAVERQFKTWYSIFPPNQSLFKAWFLSLILALILAAWVFLSLRALIEG